MLVKAADGRFFVQKLPSDQRSQDLLFNEAYASQLGAALNLSFPAWSELTAYSSGSYVSSYGSELVAGDLFEYLPRGWHQNVENGFDAYRCLLFDLWCNHADSRQVVFQARSPRVFRAVFFDHDQMFSPDDGAPVSKRIAKARCLDGGIYKYHAGGLFHDLRQFADRIRLLVRRKVIQHSEKSVPATWGSIAHRKQVLSGLERRSKQLDEYVEGIVQFVAGVQQ